MLDGSFDAWQRAGLPCAAGAPLRHPAIAAFGAPFPGCPHYMIDLRQAQALLLQPAGALVSIRTWDEFAGKTSGYSYIQAKGDIPGALLGHAGSNVHPDLQTAFYCGTGWRASLAFYYAWLMGWENISVYDGGWFEWSQSVFAQQ